LLGPAVSPSTGSSNRVRRRGRSARHRGR
jgi:hypothetical protein